MGGAFLACGFNNRLLSGSGVQAANTQGSMSPFSPWRQTQPLHRPLRRQRTAGMPMAAGTIQKRRQETPWTPPGHDSTAVICWPREPPCRHPGPRPVSPAVPFSRDYSAATDDGAAGAEIERAAVCILANAASSVAQSVFMVVLSPRHVRRMGRDHPRVGGGTLPYCRRSPTGDHPRVGGGAACRPMRSMDLVRIAGRDHPRVGGGSRCRSRPFLRYGTIPA